MTAGVQEGEHLGLLRADRAAVSFSHELARRAVERGLDEAQRRELNRRVLHVLAEHEANAARLTHHAVQANDIESIAAFAPVAARRAVSLESHREAIIGDAEGRVFSE